MKNNTNILIKLKSNNIIAFEKNLEMQVSKVLSRLFHYYYERTFGQIAEQSYFTIPDGLVWIAFAGSFVIWSVCIIYFLKIHGLDKFHEKKMLPDFPDKYKPFELLSPEKLCHLEVYICGIFLLPIRISLIVVTLIIHVAVIKILLLITSKPAKIT